MITGRQTATAWLNRRVATCLAFVFLCLMPSLASAQVYQHSNTTTGNIPESTNCATTLTRTFDVGTSFPVVDVDIGVLVSHPQRSDLRITLTSPAGTTVQLMSGVGSTADNVNILFNDEAATAISMASPVFNNTGPAPPYQQNFQPMAALSAFDGQNAQGTWTLVICDFVTANTGTFTRADLYLTETVEEADLSLTNMVSNASPILGSNITYTLEVKNAATSSRTATGVTVRAAMPAGVTFVSATGTGSFDNAAGIWTVGSLAPNGTATMNITVTVTASSGATINSTAEIRTSSVADPDSTPNNNLSSEDDYAFVTFTVSGARTAGIAPALVCPAGNTVHDWDSISWAAGTTSGSYALTGIGTMNFNIAISGGIFLNNFAYGGQTPTRRNVDTGGLSPAEYSIFEAVDMTSRSGTVNNRITLATAVSGVQFRVFDVDATVGQYADRITVTGFLNGIAVTPVLTNGIANYVIGNNAYGDVLSDDNSSNGNVVVTFSAPVDTINIVYGNHSAAPTNPSTQAIAIHDITFCQPPASVSVTKVSTVVSDGVSDTNPKALPEAIMRYCILVSNISSATVTNVTISDPLPANISYIPGSLQSGTSCDLGTTTAEDDDAIGADEADPFGSSFAGTNLTGTAASLAPNAAFAIIFQATIN